MKTTKLFFMAALSLLMTACSNDDNELDQQPTKAKGITITAQLAPKSSIATRAVAEGTDGDNKDIIKSSWAVDEHLAILYLKDGNQMADARIKSVDGSGNATIEFTVEEGTADNTECAIIYPLSAAKDNKTGVKDNETLLAKQDGTLSPSLDVRVGAGTIQTSTPSLTVTTEPEAKFAIWKLTLANDAKNLCIMADDLTIAGATLASAGKEFTVAVPAVSSKPVTIVANDESNNCYYYSKTGVTIAAGKYYQSSPSMTTLGTGSDAAIYKITGTSGATISNGKTVVLSGVNISSGSIKCSGNANIILMGTNTVTAAYSKAAIKIGGSGTTLTIQGTGSLTATGGDEAAGIGTGDAYNSTVTGGNIIINGGTINATGGLSAAGIGTGEAWAETSNTTNTCGTITINGGTVTTKSVSNGAGIGTGKSITRSGYNATNTCGTITINGGTVNASGIWCAAGIGTGLAETDPNYSGNSYQICGAITIGTGVTSVTATKGSESPNSIGAGKTTTGGSQTCGTITIGGDATTYATGVTTSPFTYPAP